MARARRRKNRVARAWKREESKKKIAENGSGTKVREEIKVKKGKEKGKRL